MIEIRPIKEKEIDSALSLLLYEKNDDAAQLTQKVESFRRLARQDSYDLAQQIVVIDQGNIEYTCFFATQGSHTAFIYSSPVDVSDSRIYHYSLQALNRLCQWAIEQNCNLLEVLLDTNDAARTTFFIDGGFRKLTDLAYLSYPVSPGQQKHPLEPNIKWLTYEQKYHELFKKVIKETYQGSLDCPELENLRDMEEVILSHKSAGVFNPRWWKLLLYESSDKPNPNAYNRSLNPAGVLLLSPLRNIESMELVYMGLTPGARGRGLGHILLQEALSCTQQCGLRQIMLAVDCRNNHASELYMKYGFTPLLHRSVLYYSTRWQVVMPSTTARIVEKPQPKVVPTPRPYQPHS